MASTDKRIDAYIAKSADFARPILSTLRDAIHEGCPEVQETIKWGMPFFEYKGPFCFLAAFKAHCGFGFWRAGGVLGGKAKPDEAMGQLGRITSIKDLPGKRVLLQYIKDAKKKKDEGPASPARIKVAREKKELVVPPYFTAALKKNKKAKVTFDAFTYSKQKDYVDWLTEAKTEETRGRRLETSVEWLAEGKSRNWKYERC